jgi:hypothetical protein
VGRDPPHQAPRFGNPLAENPRPTQPRIPDQTARITYFSPSPPPLPLAIRWCTDFSSDDGRTSGDGYQRRIPNRSDREVTFEDLYDTERGWIWIHRVVHLEPPHGWRADAVGSDRTISVVSRLSTLSGERTRLTIRARRRPHGIGGKNPRRLSGNGGWLGTGIGSAVRSSGIT